MLNNNHYNPFFNTGYEDLIKQQAQTSVELIKEQPKQMVKRNPEFIKKHKMIRKGGRKN